ncbi:MAG TPA: multicopper oxidase family protein [Kribbellaceae bacterium]|nr:multicopper oxidase family protein [Kribbellaceae bacterium]
MRRRRALIGTGVALAVLAPLAWFWTGSLVPDSYAPMEMGYADYGGGPSSVGHGDGTGPGGAEGHHHGADGTAVADLSGPRDGTPAVAVTLVARKQPVRLASGEQVDGYTLNGTSPGPLIRARQGDLVQVTLVNESVEGGTTLHWHGIDVPNAEDGVAGVTQNAVPVGGRHVYRFVAKRAGTYWYHSHQISHEQVRDGLLGPIVIEPPRSGPAGREVVALVHTYDERRTIDGRTGQHAVDVPAGTRVRVRVLNTDNGILRTGLVGAPYTVVAVDGRDVNGPTPVNGSGYKLPAGGRVDLEATVPSDGSALRLDAGSAATSLLIGPPGARGPDGALGTDDVDLLTYGAAKSAAGFDPEHADRSFEYRIGRRPGFLDGRPGLWWTINGKQFPDVPMFMVAEGDVVRMRIENGSGQAHPMHLHGHHALVLSRNGVAATGSPWWTDSLEVGNDETYEVAFVADNPGVWMDHCHNLPHAAQGLVTHLGYLGVHDSFRIGDHENEPE